jgi:hypothetical protein
MVKNTKTIKEYTPESVGGLMLSKLVTTENITNLSKMLLNNFKEGYQDIFTKKMFLSIIKRDNSFGKYLLPDWGVNDNLELLSLLETFADKSVDDFISHSYVQLVSNPGIVVDLELGKLFIEEKYKRVGFTTNRLFFDIDKEQFKLFFKNGLNSSVEETTTLILDNSIYKKDLLNVAKTVLKRFKARIGTSVENFSFGFELLVKNNDLSDKVDSICSKNYNSISLLSLKHLEKEFEQINTQKILTGSSSVKNWHVQHLVVQGEFIGYGEAVSTGAFEVLALFERLSLPECDVQDERLIYVIITEIVLGKKFLEKLTEQDILDYLKTEGYLDILKVLNHRYDVLFESKNLVANLCENYYWPVGGRLLEKELNSRKVVTEVLSTQI